MEEEFTMEVTFHLIKFLSPLNEKVHRGHTSTYNVATNRFLLTTVV